MNDEIEKLKTEIENLREQIKEINRTLKYITISVKNVLKRRGFNFFSSCPTGELMIPQILDPKILEKFYKYFKKYSFRLFLRDIIKNKEKIKLEELVHFCSLRTVKKYLNFLNKAEIIEKLEGNIFQLKNRNINTFGVTLEWFITQIFEREFNSPADWRVKILNLKSGGDFDVIAVVEQMMVFVEVKSSPPKHIHQNVVSEFFLRIDDLNPDISIFFVDTHLRLKDKINVMFGYELNSKNCKYEIKNFFSKIYCVNNNIFIVNSKPDIITNFRECLKYYFKNRTFTNY